MTPPHSEGQLQGEHDGTITRASRPVYSVLSFSLSLYQLSPSLSLFLAGSLSSSISFFLCSLSPSISLLAPFSRALYLSVFRSLALSLALSLAFSFSAAF